MDYLQFKEQLNKQRSLQHHGIKGQRWGIRRFQNEDGSLTPEGEKRYYKDPNKLRNALYKEVKKTRKEQTGWINQWHWANTIGANSKYATDKEVDEYNSKIKPYSDEMDKIWKDYEQERISSEEYDKRFNELYKEYSKIDYGFSKIIGERFSNEALKHVGNINIGYIKDLGFNENTAKTMNEILKNSKHQQIY